VKLPEEKKIRSPDNYFLQGHHKPLRNLNSQLEKDRYSQNLHILITLGRVLASHKKSDASSSIIVKVELRVVLVAPLDSSKESRTVTLAHNYSIYCIVPVLYVLYCKNVLNRYSRIHLFCTTYSQY
jgi:hypothetical protein